MPQATTNVSMPKCFGSAGAVQIVDEREIKSRLDDALVAVIDPLIR